MPQGQVATILKVAESNSRGEAIAEKEVAMYMDSACRAISLLSPVFGAQW